MKVNDDNRSIRDLDCFGNPLPTDDDKAIVEKYHSTDYETPQVPKNDVIEDMGNECGIISSAARDYYYKYYADEEERAAMDEEDRMSDLIFRIAIILIALILAASMIKGMINIDNIIAR